MRSPPRATPTGHARREALPALAGLRTAGRGSCFRPAVRAEEQLPGNFLVCSSAGSARFRSETMGKVRGLRARVHQAAVRPRTEPAPGPAAPVPASAGGAGAKVRRVRRGRGGGRGGRTGEFQTGGPADAGPCRSTTAPPYPEEHLLCRLRRGAVRVPAGRRSAAPRFGACLARLFVPAGQEGGWQSSPSGTFDFAWLLSLGIHPTLPCVTSVLARSNSSARSSIFGTVKKDLSSGA